jgi:glycosyltransferase involved in cell wall biosynthesis
MRILQVNSAQNLGGGENHVLQLSEKLSGLGHEVILAGRPNSPLNPAIVLPFRNSADYLSALRLRKILRQEKVDIVHAHVARDYPIIAAAAFRLPQVTVVFTRHLLYPVTPHPLYRRVDGWLAPTKEIANTLGALKPKRLAVIPNWVDLRTFKFCPHELHSPVHIGLLGQISPHKGHDDAIECLRLLGREFRLFIAGEGDTRYINDIKWRSTGLSVEFPGFVSLPQFFETIDILIVPSWHEPFGIVLLEAMSHGIPVIATSRGGPLEIIVSGENGLLVLPQQPVELAHAVRQLVDSDSTRLSLIERARARVEFDFDIDNVIPQIEAFYRSIRKIGPEFSWN